MVTPLPYQGNILWGSKWTTTTIKDVFKAGSYQMEQTRGTWPFEETGSIEWVLEKDELKAAIAEFKSKRMMGLYEYDYEYEDQPIIIRPVGDMTTQEQFGEFETILTMSFRRIGV